MSLEKLGIIIPYRNRYTQLDTFTKHIVEYLTDKDINYKIIIVEQDDAKLFNRGMLLNIGYRYAKKLRCDYLVFHDIDMLPIDVDYSLSEYPVHLATDIIPDDDEPARKLFDSYFGGVTMFPIEDFEKINGYSNKYWGWGFEDDDLLYRCKINELDLDTIKIKKNYSTIHVWHNSTRGNRGTRCPSNGQA
jgi:predicted glycosyltransferase involved in capsule biosynthesis